MFSSGKVDLHILLGSEGQVASGTDERTKILVNQSIMPFQLLKFIEPAAAGGTYMWS